MAEAAGFDPRRLLLMGGVVLVVVFSVLFFLFRGCAPMGGGPKNAGLTVIYSNLELKDAANVIARLKELAIPYEIRDEGRAIAVPKEKADLARLGLAEKKLPAGGQVGWEIFDESRLGATDFDRRIQLIRAISGELARNIQRIKGVEDARVQVVIPETQLFAATVAPVTAAVLLRLQPGKELTPEEIDGIVHLVASSVENLQTQNVTVIDESGRILTGQKPQSLLKYAPAPTPAEQPVTLLTPETTAAVTPAPTPETVIKKEMPAATKPASKESAVKTALTATPTLTVEEKIVLKAQTKKELETDLSGKAQELLNRFYPINSIIVKVTAEIKPAKEKELKAKELKIKKLNAIVLVDNRVDFNKNLKQATFTTVAAAIAYNKKRGDRIMIQRVPFHLANPPLLVGSKAKPPAKPAGGGVLGLGKMLSLVSLGRYLWWGAALLAILAVLWWLGSLRGKTETVPPEESRPLAPPPPVAGERLSRLDQVRNMADRNPEQIAEMLKRWLSE